MPTVCRAMMRRRGEAGSRSPAIVGQPRVECFQADSNRWCEDNRPNDRPRTPQNASISAFDQRRSELREQYRIAASAPSGPGFQARSPNVKHGRPSNTGRTSDCVLNDLQHFVDFCSERFVGNLGEPLGGNKSAAIPLA